jgi:hypothetical protein
MTARNPADCQPATCERAVFFDRLHGIRRTGWIITARGWKQWRDPQLISSYEKHQSGLQLEISPSCRTISSISAVNTAKVASYAFGNERITTSIGTLRGIRRIRASSRRRLRSRLRSTMVCLCFPTITASLTCESREVTARISRCSVRSLLPAFFTNARSASRVNR